MNYPYMCFSFCRSLCLSVLQGKKDPKQTERDEARTTTHGTRAGVRF